MHDAIIGCDCDVCNKLPHDYRQRWCSDRCFSNDEHVSGNASSNKDGGKDGEIVNLGVGKSVLFRYECDAHYDMYAHEKSFQLQLRDKKFYGALKVKHNGKLKVIVSTEESFSLTHGMELVYKDTNSTFDAMSTGGTEMPVHKATKYEFRVDYKYVPDSKTYSQFRKFDSRSWGGKLHISVRVIYNRKGF